jgi:hypothetical protein
MAQNAPIKRFRIGFVTASVWKNETADRPFYTVTVQRAYKDEKGDYQNNGNFNHADLLNLSRVVVRAENWIADQ